MSTISVELAAEYLDVPKKQMWSDKRYAALLTGVDGALVVDTDKLDAFMAKRDAEMDHRYQMTAMAEWIIRRIGEKAFVEPFDGKTRSTIRKLLKEGLLTSGFANRIEDAWADKYLDAYLNDDITGNSGFVPLEERTPLDFSFVSTHYWNRKKTVGEIAKELNVPEGWVWSEIRRLGMQKTKCGIRQRGRKGYKMPEAEKAKHRKQPHAKRVSRICPYTYEVLQAYRSTGAVEEDGYRRENVRKAIKSVGLHLGFLWAHEGFEPITVKIAKQKEHIIRKELKRQRILDPGPKQFKKWYTDMNLPKEEIAQMMKCPPQYVLTYASRHGIRRPPKMKVTQHLLYDMYVREGMTAAQIAQRTGHTQKTISKYLSHFKIRKNEQHKKETA